MNPLFKKLFVVFLLSFVIVGVIGTLWAGYYLGLLVGINFGIKIGLQFALPFTLLAYVFWKAQKTIVLSGDIVMRVQANLFRSIEGVGGYLTLTHKELVFEPHILNIQNQISIIPLLEIKSVSKKNTLGIIPNEMVVYTEGDKKYRFILWHRDKVISSIEKLIHP